MTAVISNYLHDNDNGSESRNLLDFLPFSVLMAV